MQTLAIDGGRVAYFDRGAGPPVVLLHGGGSSSRQWLKTAAALEARHRVIAPDLWGFGGTDAWSGAAPLTQDDQARLVASVVEQCCDEPIHLVGHSYGGATAVRFLLAYPERVRSTVLIEPGLMQLLKRVGDTARYREWADMIETFVRHADAGRLEDAWQGFIDYRNGAGKWNEMPPASRARLVATTATTLAGFGSLLSNPTTLEDLASVRAPTLVLVGENTTAPDRAVATLVSGHIPGAALESLPGAEHMSPLTHPELVAAAIERHVTRVAANDAS